MYVDRTVLSSLALFKYYDFTGWYVNGEVLLDIDNVVALSANSTTNSIRHVQQELASAISAVAQLLKAFDRAEANLARVHALCPKPTNGSAVCPEARSLIKGRPVVLAVADGLLELQTMLGLVLKGFASGNTSANRFDLVFSVVQMTVDKLEAQLELVRTVRQSAEAGLG